MLFSERWTYLQELLAVIHVGSPPVVIAVEPALLRGPPAIRVGRGGGDLLIGDSAGFHAQGRIALKIWSRTKTKQRNLSIKPVRSAAD